MRGPMVINYGHAWHEYTPSLCRTVLWQATTEYAPPPYRTVEAWLASAFHEDNLYLPPYRGMARGSFSMRATYTYLTAGAWVWAAFHEGSLYRLFFSPAGKTVTVLGRSYDCPCKALALC